jgi:putative transposase
MTKVLVEGCGWVSVVVVLDWYTKVIAGYYAGIRGTAKDWLGALDRALNRQFPLGVRGDGLSLLSDPGSQPPPSPSLRPAAP